MRCICIGSTILFAVGYASFATGNIYIVGANIILDGFALVPFLPVCISYAAEVTFPMQEAVIVGILQMSGQITGLLFGFTGSLAFTIKSLSDYSQTQVCLAIYITLCGIAAALSLFLKEDLRRSKYGAEKRDKSKTDFVY